MPVVVVQGAHRAGGVVGDGVQLELGHPGAVPVLAGQRVPLGGQGLVEGGPHLVEGAAEVAPASRGATHPAYALAQVVQPRPAVAAAAQQVAQRFAQGPAGEYVASDRVHRRAHVVRGGERVRPTPPGAVAEPAGIGHGQAP